jgi:hypothetical protein
MPAGTAPFNTLAPAPVAAAVTAGCIGSRSSCTQANDAGSNAEPDIAATVAAAAATTVTAHTERHGAPAAPACSCRRLAL